jgi:dTDP-4-amino-4,6-dideoxygalactose transaminase
MHLYPIKVNNRAKIFNKLREGGIGVNVHYIPIHMQPYYKSLGFKSADFPISEKYYNSAISIPLFATMTKNQQDKVIKCLEKNLK